MTRLRSEQGFTLIELVIVMPMLLIMLGGLTVVFIQFTQSNNRTEEAATLQTEARAALDTLETDIREAFVGDGTDPVISASATSITFESPDRYPTTVAGSTESSFHLRKITYTLSGGVLERQFMTSTNTFPTGPPWTWPGSNGPLASIVGSITNADVFTYYTASGAQASPPTPLTFPIADTTGIRSVRIKLTLSTTGAQPKVFTFNELVSLRETDS